MKHRQAFALSILVVALGRGGSGAAPAPPTPASLKGAEAAAAVLRLLDEWAAAYVNHDAATIDRILGEEFVMSAGRRDLQTRDEYLRKVENDREPHASITRADERVRVYGDTAVVTHLLTRTTQGRSFVFRVTDVCVQRAGRWQLVNRHITEVPQPPVRSAIEDPEAYAVWATLLADHWIVRHARAKTLVIQHETATDSVCTESEESMQPDWRRVLDSYKSANAAVHTVLAGDRLGRPYVVVPSHEIKALFKQPAPIDGWSEFHRRYPDSRGYLQVSAVGFDADRRRAIVYMAHHCGWLCGGGQHHLLEKVDGTWRKADLPGLLRCVWVS